MTQTNMTTGVSKPSTIQVTWMEDSMGLYTEVKLRGIKVNAMRTVLSNLRVDLRAEALLNYMLDIAAKELGFDNRIKIEEVIHRLVNLRGYILRLPELREDSLVASSFKDAFKKKLSPLAKKYYKLCHKEQIKHVNERLDEVFVFDVRQGTIVKL